MMQLIFVIFRLPCLYLNYDLESFTKSNSIIFLLEFEVLFGKIPKNLQNNQKSKNKLTSVHFQALSNPNAKVTNWGLYHSCAQLRQKIICTIVQSKKIPPTTQYSKKMIKFPTKIVNFKQTLGQIQKENQIWI